MSGIYDLGHPVGVPFLLLPPAAWGAALAVPQVIDRRRFQRLVTVRPSPLNVIERKCRHRLVILPFLSEATTVKPSTLNNRGYEHSEHPRYTPAKKETAP